MPHGRQQGHILRGIEEIIDPHLTAFIIVDAQNDFVSTDGWMAKFGVDVTHIQAAISRINDFISTCHSMHVPVIYIREVISRSTVLPNYLSHYGEFDTLPVREGTWGAEFYDGLTPPESQDRVIIKPCYDGFEDTNLDVTLRSMHIKTCVYAGFASNVCVEATARHGFVKGYYSVLLLDASACGTLEEHDACRRVFQTFYGPVVETRQIAELWRRVGGRVPATITPPGVTT